MQGALVKQMRLPMKKLLIAAVLGLGTLLGYSATQASAAAMTRQHCHTYHVYYRTCPHSCWTCYGCYDCPCDAHAAATHLRHLGYLVSIRESF
jgi:hypothetical protein